MKHSSAGYVVGCVGVMVAACGGTSPSSLAFGTDAGTSDGSRGSSSDAGRPPLPRADGSIVVISDGGGPSSDGGIAYQDGDVVVATTIYANTDTALYELDPSSNTVTLVGNFVGNSDASTDRSITDLAVNAAGDLYANSESKLYKVTLPATPGTGATVQLTYIATIGATSSAKDAGAVFFALGFTPAGLLGAGESLVGGDSDGELWSIDPTSGALQDLGNFGKDPNVSGNTLALSGDVVFYTDYGAGGPGSGPGTVRALATIRSCKGSSCTAPSDYLAGIDIQAMQTNYVNNNKSLSLLGGIYGAPVGPDGGTTGTGSGIGFKDVYGLGAWQGSVYGFTYAYSSDAGTAPPQLILVDTASGTGSVVSTPSIGFTKDGWAGAGVTTSVTITLPPPPPPPPVPQ